MSATMIKIYAGVLVVGFVAGWTVNQWRIDAGHNQALQDARKIEQLEQDRADALGRAAAAERAALEAEGRVIIKEVIRYAESDGAGRCDLSGDWLRTHNQAAGVPEAGATPGGTTDTPDTVATDVDALRVVTENYAICRENMRRQEALVEWFTSRTD